jgi:hypothetical protein
VTSWSWANHVTHVRPGVFVGGGGKDVSCTLRVPIINGVYLQRKSRTSSRKFDSWSDPVFVGFFVGFRLPSSFTVDGMFLAFSRPSGISKLPTFSAKSKKFYFLVFFFFLTSVSFVMWLAWALLFNHGSRSKISHVLRSRPNIGYTYRTHHRVQTEFRAKRIFADDILSKNCQPVPLFPSNGLEVPKSRGSSQFVWHRFKMSPEEKWSFGWQLFCSGSRSLTYREMFERANNWMFGLNAIKLGWGPEAK